VTQKRDNGLLLRKKGGKARFQSWASQSGGVGQRDQKKGREGEGGERKVRTSTDPF